MIITLASVKARFNRVTLRKAFSQKSAEILVFGPEWLKSFVVDFRSALKSAELDSWATSLHPMRSIGAAYAPSMEQTTFGQTTVGKDYDGLFFIDATTRFPIRR